MSWFGAQKMIVKIAIILALLGGGIGLVFVVQNNREDKNTATDTKENTENRIVKPSKGIGSEEETDSNNGIEDIALAVPNLEIGGDFLPPIAKRKAPLKKPNIVPITSPSQNLGNITIPNTPTIPNIPEIPVVAPVSKFPVQAGALGTTYSSSNIAVFPDGSKLIGGYYTGKIVLSSDITLNSTDGNSYIAKIDNEGNYIWGKSFTQNSEDDLIIRTLADGASIIGGFFYNNAVFGTTTLTTDNNGDSYIVKIDANGNFVWVRQIGGAENQRLADIQVQADGSSIVVGDFINQAILGEITLTAADASADGYIAKVDTNGDFVWATSVGGVSEQYVSDIQLQADGSSIIGGKFYNQAVLGSTTLNSVDVQWDGYVSKVDANGDFVWATQIGGNNYQEIKDIRLQADGSSIITGQFYTEAIMGTITLTALDGDPDGYIVKIDSDGEFVWGSQIGGNNNQEINNIQIQADGSSIISGNFYNQAILGTTTLTATDWDAYIAKIDSNGEFVWGSQIGGTSHQYINNIQIQADGSSIISGNFYNQAIFGATTLTSDSWDSYIAKIDSEGNVIWVRQIGGPNNQSIKDIKLQSDNAIIVTGNFYKDAILGDTHLFGDASSDRGFIAILNSDGTVNKAQNIGFGMGGSIESEDTKVLADGSTLITGQFAGIVNLGNIALIAAGNKPYNEQEYIAKIDKYGNYLWARAIGGFEVDDGIDIIPQDNGSSIIYGDFYDTATFDNTVFTTVDNSADLFFARLNADGEYDFIKQIGGEGDQYINTPQVQADGSIIMGGNFNNQVILGSRILTATNWDSFITKIADNGDFIWVTQIGGTGEQYINSTQVQADGSSIINGQFMSQAILGTTTLTAIGWDRYITKIDSNGNYVWVTQIGGEGDQSIDDIQVQADGSYIVLGFFFNEVILGTTILNATDYDAFIAKIDSNGEFVWVNQVGGAGDQYINIPQVQADGSIIIRGGFYSQAILGVTTLTAIDWDSYIAKLDSNGEFVWVSQVGGSFNQDIDDVQVQADGSSIIKGYNVGNGDIILGAITLNATGLWGDKYIAKIDNDGNYVWANRLGGFNWSNAREIVLQTDGSSIVYGDFYDTSITFGATTLTPNGEGNDGYIAKIDNDGNYVWARQIAGLSGQWIDNNAQVQADGSMIFAGGFYNQAIFGTTILTAIDNDADRYISKIDRDGNFVWVSQVGGIDEQYIDQFRIQNDGNIIVAGYFDKEIIFSQPGLPSQSLSHTSRNGDIYVARLNPNGVWE